MHGRTLTGRRRIAPRALGLALAAALLVAEAALAGDGRVQINQGAALAGGVTTQDAPGFPVTISQSGSYVLTGDLVVTDPALDAIDVRAGGVALDLNGFQLIGPQVCNGEANQIVCTPDGPENEGDGIGSSGAAYPGLIVRNGTIRGFEYGIQVLHRPLIISNLRVDANAQRGIETRTSVIVHSSANRNDGAGIQVIDTLIAHSTVSGNQSGIQLPSIGRSALVTDVSSRNNGLRVLNGLITGTSTHTGFGPGLTIDGCGLIIDSTSRLHNTAALRLGANAAATRTVLVPGSGPAVDGTTKLPNNLCSGGVCP